MRPQEVFYWRGRGVANPETGSWACWLVADLLEQCHNELVSQTHRLVLIEIDRDGLLSQQIDCYGIHAQARRVREARLCVRLPSGPPLTLNSIWTRCGGRPRSSKMSSRASERKGL